MVPKKDFDEVYTALKDLLQRAEQANCRIQLLEAQAAVLKFEPKKNNLEAERKMHESAGFHHWKVK